MIIDFKYHIASLVAVFLALALGILIGTSMIGSDTIVKKQESLIASLQKQYDSLRDENRQNSQTIDALNEEKGHQHDFNEAVLPVLVRDKLTGHRVSIVDLNYNKAHDALATILKNAGAEVSSVTVVNLGSLKDASVAAQVASAVGKDQKAAANDYLPEVAKALAVSLNGVRSPAVEQLKGKDFLKVAGSFDQPAQDLVLIGGSPSNDRNYVQSFDLVLAKSLQDDGIKVYGVEDSKVPVSYMRNYQSARLTTVDDIDSNYGQLALVGAMSGYPGHYGIKQTADSFLPPL